MFSEAKARRVTQFIECLKHTKGEFHGEPFKLLPWQEKIIRDVFGTVRDDDPSMRQYNTAYIEIPKKNGKSELGAAIALNMLCNDDEWRAEVYSCASDRQQAAIVFDVAVDMVKQSPALSKRIKIIPSTKRMVYQPTGSIYQVLSSEVATKHGLNVSACIFDELHTQPTRALYDVMTQGSGDARKQPLWFLLTTAGTDRNSICWEVHQKALDIIEGRKDDPRFYPVLYGLPDDADWTDEKNWYKPRDSVSAAPVFYFGTSGAGKSVTAQTAIQLSTVYACVRVISETVASLPLGVYEATDDGNLKAGDHPLYHLLHDEPNAEMTSFVFREVMLAHTEGGYLVPDEYERTLIEALEEQNIFRQLAHVIHTSSGERKIPVVASKGTASWIDEEAAYPESDDTFGQVSIGAYKLATMIKVSEELLNDSVFDVPSYIAREFARRIGAAEEEAFFTGNGTGRPLGILAATGGAETGATAAAADKITFDEVMDLFYSLRTPYRRNAVFIMNDATVKALRKLKTTGGGDYIWQPSVTAGTPDTILNRPVYTSGFMPTLAAGAKTVLFGDLNYYWVADREGRSFKRLNELYAPTGQVGFLASQRVDGKLILPEAVKVLQQA